MRVARQVSGVEPISTDDVSRLLRVAYQVSWVEPGETDDISRLHIEWFKTTDEANRYADSVADKTYDHKRPEPYMDVMWDWVYEEHFERS
jgi:hypothetical protein